MKFTEVCNVTNFEKCFCSHFFTGTAVSFWEPFSWVPKFFKLYLLSLVWFYFQRRSLLLFHLLCVLHVASVHAAVETVGGEQACSRCATSSSSSDLFSRGLPRSPSCRLKHHKPSHHRRLLSRLWIPVDQWAAGGAGGQFSEQRDSRLSEDGPSAELGSEWLRRLGRRWGQRRLQPVGRIPVLCAAEGGGGWRGEQR